MINIQFVLNLYEFKKYEKTQTFSEVEEEVVLYQYCVGNDSISNKNVNPI